MSRRRKAGAALAPALIGATLLFHGEDADPPRPGDAPRPDDLRVREPEAMPEPELGLFRLEHVAPAMPPAATHQRRSAASPAVIGTERADPIPSGVIAEPPVAASAEPPPTDAGTSAVAEADEPIPTPVPVAASAATVPVAAPGPTIVASPLAPTPAEAAGPPLPAPEPSPVLAKATPAIPAEVEPPPAADAAPAPPPPVPQVALAQPMPVPAFGHAIPSPPPAPGPAEPAGIGLPDDSPVIAVAPVHAAPSHQRFPAPAFGRSAAPVAPAMPEPAFARPATPTSASNLPRPTQPAGFATAPATNPAAALATPGSPPMAGFVPAAPFSSDDELILQLETAHGELAETITGYGTRTGVYLPLGELARLLDLAITISDDGRYAAGWVLDESNRVTVNLREGTLHIGAPDGGREIVLAPRDAAAFDGELYLRAERFADLMPLVLAVDLRAQAVRVRTLQPFPFEQRVARDEARNRLGTRDNAGAARRYPREPDPWTALSFPLGDVELRGVSDTARGTRGEADLRLAGDLAFMTARVFAGTSSRDGLVAARVELGRRDPDSRLLGPLRATEFQLGDIGTAALPIGLRGIAGRGAMLTNQPLERLSVFDRIDLRGELPAGWEAELYRNNTLVGSTRQAVNGRYEFLQVPVEFGLNVFRLVLYGPQGQRREEVRRIGVGDGRLARGEFQYSVGLAQKDVNLAGVHPKNFVPGLDYGAWRASAQVQYGLTTGLTVALDGAWYQSGGHSHWLAGAGLRTGLAGLATRLDLAVEDGRGEAISTALGGHTWGINWTASHAEYLGRFTDEVRAFTGEALRRASRFDLAANLHLGGASRRMPLAGRFERIEFADGRSEIDAGLRASMLIARVLASNSLGFTRTIAPGQPGRSRLTGTFDLATLSSRKTQLRGALDYSLTQGPRLDAVQVEVDRAFGTQTLVKAALSRTFATGETGFGLSAVRRFERLSLAFDGTYSVPSGNYAAILRLGFGFGRNPLDGRLFTARPGLSDSGAVAIRAWQDADGNGRYDPHEPLLRDVEFDTGAATGKTDARGIALIGGIGDGTRTSVHIDAETLPDIAMAPASEGLEIVPRAGRIHVSQFAIQALSDIEGTARFGAGNGVSGLALVLVDAAGKPMARTRSESGGGFLFEQVRPGAYRIVLDPGQARRLAIVLVEEPAVRVGNTASVVRVDVQAASAPH